MEYVVLDLEWNQPETVEETVREPISFPGEIIQIGAVKLDENFEIIDTLDIIIKPVYYLKLNTFVADLTHLSEEELSRGLPFLDGINKFREWCPEECLFLIWGNCDKKILKQNIRIHGEKYNWLPHAVNIQSLFSAFIVEADRCFSLTEAAAHIGEAEFVAHNALTDAFVTAKIARYMKLKSVDFTAENVAQKTNIPSYASAKNARNAQANRTFSCSNCGEALRCNWHSNHGQKCYSLTKCSCGAQYFISLIIKTNSDGTKRANRTVRTATNKDIEFFKEKVKEEKIKERNRFISHINYINRKKFPNSYRNKRTTRIGA